VPHDHPATGDHGGGKLSSCPLTARHVEIGAVVAEFPARAFDFLQIRANFLPIISDLVFACPVTDIPAQFGAVLSQFGTVVAQLVAALLHFLARFANNPVVVPSCRLGRGPIVSTVLDYVIGLWPVCIVVPGVMVVGRVASVIRLSMVVMSMSMNMARPGRRTMGVRAPTAMFVVTKIMFALAVFFVVVMSLGRRD
jgi:hypothetical protein